MSEPGRRAVSQLCRLQESHDPGAQYASSRLAMTQLLTGPVVSNLRLMIVNLQKVRLTLQLTSPA